MGEPPNPHFYDFGVFERFPEPQNQLFLSLETPEHLEKQKKSPKPPQTILCSINRIAKARNSFFVNFGKDGHRMMKIRLTKS